jgi:competence protein ComFC
MKCLLCKNYSFLIICKSCQNSILTPSFHTRELPNGFKIYSFYQYSEISDLLKTKHRFIGHQIYSILAKNSFAKFSKMFNFNQMIYSISIDDKVDSGYSHTAILNRALKSKNIIPLYSKINSSNSVKYSGQSLEYRLKHPRGFKSDLKGNLELILVDDIVTTATTILEARMTLKKMGHNPVFALCLADAKEL